MVPSIFSHTHAALPESAAVSSLDALSERDENAEPVVAETTVINRNELPIRIRRAEPNQRVPEIPRLGCFHLDHPDDKSLVVLTRYESDNDLKDFENVPGAHAPSRVVSGALAGDLAGLA